jgi:hypothetical protein
VCVCKTTPHLHIVAAACTRTSPASKVVAQHVCGVEPPLLVAAAAPLPPPGIACFACARRQQAPSCHKHSLVGQQQPYGCDGELLKALPPAPPAASVTIAAACSVAAAAWCCLCGCLLCAMLLLWGCCCCCCCCSSRRHAGCALLDSALATPAAQPTARLRHVRWCGGVGGPSQHPRATFVVR